MEARFPATGCPRNRLTNRPSCFRYNRAARSPRYLLAPQAGSRPAKPAAALIRVGRFWSAMHRYGGDRAPGGVQRDDSSGEPDRHFHLILGLRRIILRLVRGLLSTWPLIPGPAAIGSRIDGIDSRACGTFLPDQRDRPPLILNVVVMVTRSSIHATWIASARSLQWDESGCLGAVLTWVKMP